MIKLGQRGNVAIIFALLLIPLIGMVGLAVDTARAYSVKLRLQEAIDSAALVGAKNYTASDRNQMIQDYFDANWRSGFMDTNTPTLTFTPDDTDRSITVYALVTMPTIFMRIFGTPSVTVGTLTASVSGQTYLEVAVALDNTMSMRTLVAGDRRVDLMKAAAVNFIDTLYTVNGIVQETVDNMWVSIIPFTSMVNVGSQHTNFLVSGSTGNIVWEYPRTSVSAQNAWRGCLFERSFYVDSTYNANDTTDASPATEAFYPYHVALGQSEALTFCKGPPAPPPPPTLPPPPTPPTPPAPPPPPPYTPPCIEDGVPCKVQVNPVKIELPPSPGFLDVSGCRVDNGVGPGLRTWWTGYNIYPPALSYTTAAGFVVQYPSTDGVTPYGYNAAYPSTYNNSSNPANNVNGVSACCYGGWYGNSSDGFDNLAGWTATGRWIRPWPTTGAVKIGGWGNSGCGLPMLPLTSARSTLISKINEMDVPPSAGSGNPELGYNGTLINQGLVWGWRSVSALWQGFWKNPDGTAIDATLPMAYGTAGSSKAVVVMTDGLNFLEDQNAKMGYGYGCSGWCPYYFGAQSISLTVGDTNLGSTFNYSWRGVDSSAYATINRDIRDNMPFATAGDQLALSFCRFRQAKGDEPVLATWGCRQYDCMLRKPDGTCTRSGVDTWGPYDVQSALTGSYYDELTRRLLVTCSNMRARNIRIFFILFDINNNPQKASAMAAFNSCVGSDGAVYDASDGAALNNAFSAIAIKLRELRLRQ